MPQSKEQIAARKKEYNKKNKEQRAAYAKKYYEKNKEYIKAKNKEYRKLNKEIIASKKKQHYGKRDKKARRNYNVEYYKKNKEKYNSSSSKWYCDNKETVIAANRKRKYGISPEEYAAMLEEQDNKCKICLVSFTNLSSRHIHTDHCHTTNKIRGLLCNFCNVGLGHFKDNTKLLTNAIVYLEHTQE